MHGGPLRSNRHDNSRLDRLFELGMGQPVAWDDWELAAILRHQLTVSLLADLKPLASQLQHIGLASQSAGGGPPQTFADLLRHPKPNLALLRLAKDFAKTADARLEDPLPSPVTTALYLSVIAAALVRHSERISAMTDSELRAGFEWTASQPWIGARLRQLARRAVALL